MIDINSGTWAHVVRVIESRIQKQVDALLSPAMGHKPKADADRRSRMNELTLLLAALKPTEKPNE